MNLVLYVSLAVYSAKLTKSKFISRVLTIAMSATLLAIVPVSAETNIWISTASTNASVAANWSLNHAPIATDNIMLCESSTVDMTWDATNTVASWEQTLNYTGTVTFLTTYTGASPVFTNFMVTSNVVIQKGTWTHLSNSTSQIYHLQIAVGGNFTLASNATINLQYKGYGIGKYPPGGAAGVHAGGQYSFKGVYGNPYKPYDLGAGNSGYAGGGALWLECNGDVAIDGTIKANSGENNDAWTQCAAGAAGSVYIKAKTVSGSGYVYINGPYIGRGKGASGGRAAFELTDSEEMTLPVSNVYSAGSLGYGYGGGTIVVKGKSQLYGTLFVKHNERTPICDIMEVGLYGTTPVTPGETWTFDRIVTSNFGIFSVPTNTTLVLPNGFGSVSGSGKTAGILYLGGTIDAQGADAYTFRSNWVFHANSPYVITGDVQIVDNGAVGLLRLDNRNITNHTKCVLTVVGNMTVDSTSWLYARRSGYHYNTLPSGDRTAHGGQQDSTKATNAYDSILNPSMPGCDGHIDDSANMYPGGGAIRLTITGTLTLNGTVESSGWYKTGCESASPANGMLWDYRPGPGGSLNITAGSLLGTGRITAPGLSGNYSTNSSGDGGKSPKGSVGGGRIAVRLTDPGASFDSFGITNIIARGASYSSTNYQAFFSSAGTVYLQNGSEAEGKGTVYIRNDNNVVNTNSVTWFPSTRYGGENDDFNKASLSVEECAIVKLSKSVSIGGGLTIKPNSIVDLNGYELRTMGMKTNGVPIPVGTYTATDFASCVTDSSDPDTGSIIIANAGVLIIFR